MQNKGVVWLAKRVVGEAIRLAIAGAVIKLTRQYYEDKRRGPTDPLPYSRRTHGY